VRVGCDWLRLLLLLSSSTHDAVTQLMLKDNVLQLTAAVCCQVPSTLFHITHTHTRVAFSFSAMTFCTQREKALSNWTINSIF